MASQTPTGASQRLLTLKFMQRAAAAASSPTSPSTPTSDDGRASKRRKTSGKSSLDTPKTPSHVIDQKAAQAALEEEEKKRQEHAAKQAEKLGDSYWVLDAAKLPEPERPGGKLLSVVQVGFSQIDKAGADDGEALVADATKSEGPSLTTYGPRKKTPKKDEKSGVDSDSDSSVSGTSDSSSQGLIGEALSKSGRASYGSHKRSEIRSRQSTEREKAQKLAKERRKKGVKLNTLTSISGAASNSFGRR